MKMQLVCVVKGRVQGVMFRDFVQRKARGLDIVGTVQNQPDGSVFVVATGEEEKLKKLLEFLHKGPLLTMIRHKIDTVETTWGNPIENFSGFEILY